MRIAGVLCILFSANLTSGVFAQTGKELNLEAGRREAAYKKKFVGIWEGKMEQAGYDPFPVRIELKEYEFGKWCGVIKHPAPIDAEGKLLGVDFVEYVMIVSATITRGRDRCQDGISELKLLVDGDTMERIWYNPETGKPAAKGKLKRQK